MECCILHSSLRWKHVAEILVKMHLHPNLMTVTATAQGPSCLWNGPSTTHSSCTIYECFLIRWGNSQQKDHQNQTLKVLFYTQLEAPEVCRCPLPVWKMVGGMLLGITPTQQQVFCLGCKNKALQSIWVAPSHRNPQPTQIAGDT